MSRDASASSSREGGRLVIAALAAACWFAGLAWWLGLAAHLLSVCGLPRRRETDEGVVRDGCE